MNSTHPGEARDAMSFRELVAWAWALWAPLCIGASVVLQKVGHSLERQPPHPFTGFRDFVRRFYAEQFCNFWRYLFSGQWYASLTSPVR